MFIALSIVALAIGGLGYWFFWADNMGLLSSLFLGSLWSVLAFSVLVIVPGAIVGDLTADDTTFSAPIYELGDGSSTSGAFGLFGGSINSEPAFMYYIRNNNGAYELRQVEADHVEIVQDDSVRPHYEKTCKDDSTVPGWLRVPFFKYSEINCDDGAKYTFYVPVGSIKGAYDLDAE